MSEMTPPPTPPDPADYTWLNDLDAALIAMQGRTSEYHDEAEDYLIEEGFCGD